MTPMNQRMVKQLNGNVSQISDVELLILSKKLTELKDRCMMEYEFRKICRGD